MEKAPQAITPVFREALVAQLADIEYKEPGGAQFQYILPDDRLDPVEWDALIKNKARAALSRGENVDLSRLCLGHFHKAIDLLDAGMDPAAVTEQLKNENVPEVDGTLSLVVTPAEKDVLDHVYILTPAESDEIDRREEAAYAALEA
jgi:hypothetical protein